LGLATTHRADPMRLLRLVNRRFAPGMDFSDPVARKHPWLDRNAFSAIDQRQIVECVVYLHTRPELTEDDFWSGDFDFFWKHFDGIAEVPLEGWDVVDSDDVVCYQIWIVAVDHGTVLDAGTTREVD